MPDYLVTDKHKMKEKDDKLIKSLDERDIVLLKTYVEAPYTLALWDLAADKVCLAREQLLQVTRYTKFINDDDLNKTVTPTDIEEGPMIHPSVTMMQVEEESDVTYSEVGG